MRGLVSQLRLVLGTVIAGTVLSVPSAAAQPSAAPPAAERVEPATATVTLVTGDRITVNTLPDGRRAVSVHAAIRSSGIPVRFDSYTAEGNQHVVPSDAQPHVLSGVLDPDLFNLDVLIREGTTESPRLIVTYHGAAGRQRSAAPDGTYRTAMLTSIGGEGLRLDDASGFWRSLTTSLRSSTAKTPSTGTAKVWLDRAVHADLDQSVPQIRAPAAWEAGIDGSGVRVAVLDTGIDTDHPDVAGKIAASENFTTEPSVQDGHGHGTHVASTVAGSGAASGGRFKGVAPGATLLVGKVLDSGGNGTLSQVIAGMEWAAGNGAKVINLSLGAGPSDGTDPASQAVNALTAQTGALFVIAAGNNEGDGSVNTPGAADAALTVGAVDKSDVLTDFSNRGPRQGDAAVKPEITAPGAGIVAARAAGTAMGTPVDASYTTASGTSMATPHVAGAAALLAQHRPGWTSGRLKDALVSTAQPGEYTPFQQGAGRVDVPRSIDQDVYGPAAVSLGRITERQTRDLVYRNDSTAPVSLDLTLTAKGWDGRPAPAGEFALSATTVDIAAGGEASVTLAVDPEVTADRGVFTGVVTATGAGGVTVRTPFSIYESTATEKLTVRPIDRRGAAVDDATLVVLYRLDGAVPNDPFQQAFQQGGTVDGQITFDVSPGSYDVYGQVTEFDVDRLRSSVVGATELTVTDDLAVTLDARQAVRRYPKAVAGTELLMAVIGLRHGLPDGSIVGLSAMFGIGFQTWDLYVAPGKAVRTGWLDVYDNSVLGTRLVEARVHGATKVSLTPAYFSYFAAPAFEGTRKLPVVAVGEGRPEDIDPARVRGKLVLARIPIPAGEPFRFSYAWNLAQEITARAAGAGAAGALFYIDVPGALGMELHSTPIIQLGLPQAQGAALDRALRREKVSITLTGSRTPADVYRLRYVRPGGSHEAAHPPTPDPARMTAIDTRYHGEVPNTTYHTAWHVFDGHYRVSAMVLTPLWGPARVTEHVEEIGPDLLFARTTSQAVDYNDISNAGLHQSRDVITRPSTGEVEKWFQAPVRRGAFDSPGYPSTLRCGLCLDGDRFYVGQHYLDSDPRHYGLTLSGTSDFRLFRGTTEIPMQGSSRPFFQMPAVPATYRLEAVDRQPVDTRIRTLAPRTTTTWTFSAVAVPAGTRPHGYSCPASGDEGSCGFQPLLSLRYDLGLDIRNRAEAGRTHRFDVTAGAHSAALGRAKVTGLRVWMSTDNGAHWRDARVHNRGNGSFRVEVDHPRHSSGTVWLRMQAWDSKGGRVDQTVERAYILK